MISLRRIPALVALVAMVLAGFSFWQLDNSKLSKFELLSPSCELAVSQMLTDTQCGEDTYLVEFASAAAQVLEDTQRSESLEASLETMGLSAYELNGQELGLLARNPSVVRIVPNVEFSIAGTQSDAPWQLDRIEQPEPSFDGSYSYADDELGAGVTIYVVDTGVNVSHREFTGRIGTGFSAVGTSTDVIDCNGHGTHVAGLAAGSTFGAAKQATIVPVRVLGCDGRGTLAAVLTGLDWIARNTLVGQAAVVNMSLGGQRNTLLDSAIGNLTSQGLAFVVAAGNDAVDACTFSPAASPGVISVAASSKDDAWSVFSNFGSCVDLIAPGAQVSSSWIGTRTAASVQSGTSMAAAAVSGVIANQMSNGHQAPEDLLAALNQTGARGKIAGIPPGTPNLLLQDTVIFGSSDSGNGGSLGEIPVVEDDTEVGIVEPDPAENLPNTYSQPTVTVSGTVANVAWVLPADAGTYSGQILKVFSGSTEFASIDLPPSATSFTLQSLAPGIVYRVAVAGVNSLGTGVLSPPSEPFDVELRPFGPNGGEFSAWTKRVSATEVKFYAKYPQLGQKIQFMVQQPDGRYREIAWLRIGVDDLDGFGDYVNLQNKIYLIRTIKLREGKNRLRIVVDDVIWNRTVTYTL